VSGIWTETAAEALFAGTCPSVGSQALEVEGSLGGVIPGLNAADLPHHAEVGLQAPGTEAGETVLARLLPEQPENAVLPVPEHGPLLDGGQDRCRCVLALHHLGDHEGRLRRKKAGGNASQKTSLHPADEKQKAKTSPERKKRTKKEDQSPNLAQAVVQSQTVGLLQGLHPALKEERKIEVHNNTDTVCSSCCCGKFLFFNVKAKYLNRVLHVFYTITKAGPALGYEYLKLGKHYKIIISNKHARRFPTL